MGAIGKNCQLSLSMLSELIAKPAILGGILSFILGLVGYGYVLSKMKLNIAYPLMTSICFLIITLASRFFLKESITPHSNCGIPIHSFRRMDGAK
jgi:multidrug transporter EmrE-like cation transporter